MAKGDKKEVVISGKNKKKNPFTDFRERNKGNKTGPIAHKKHNKKMNSVCAREEN